MGTLTMGGRIWHRALKTTCSAALLLGLGSSSMSWAALTEDQVLATAEASPAAVGIHDKEAWLALFAGEATIEDPVGTEPHRSECNAGGECDNQAHSAFWNTFIAPNDIIFHVKEDIVAGNEIVRDVDIETHLSSGVVLVVPTHLRYRIVEEQVESGNEPRIQQLAAHWEIGAMIGQVLGDDAGLQTGAELALRMLEEQGLDGALGYLKGMTVGMFEEGKWKARRFADAVTDGSRWELVNLFHWWQGDIEYPVAGQTLSLNEFADRRGDLSLSLTDLRSAGFYTSARFQLVDNGVVRSGIVFFRFDEWTRRIKQVRFFWSE